jgi:transcriptional regulator with XRE-family HTH domain
MAYRTRPATNHEDRRVTAERLAQLMRDRGINLSTLAANLRIQESTLGNFRMGYRNLPSDVLTRMVRELGTNEDFLLARADDPRPTADIREEARLRAEARRTLL